MFLSVIDQLTVAGLAVLLGWAGWTDAHTYMIPNRVTAAIALLWPAHAAALIVGGEPVQVVLMAVPIGLLAFALGTVLFYFRALGGGDVKFLAAVTLWAGTSMFLELFVITVGAGGVLALGLLLSRTLRLTAGGPATAIGPALMAALKTPAPFGVAIAFGGFVIAMRLLGQASLLGAGH